MPKIVSSSTTSASSELFSSAEKLLHVYYCQFCGEYVLIIDKRLTKLPVRKIDKAHVITSKRTYKVNLKKGDIRIIKRLQGYEKQQRWECPRCDLPVAYDQGFSEADDIPFYVLEGAVRAGSTTKLPPAVGREVLDPSNFITAEQLIKEQKERQKNAIPMF